MTRTAFVEVKYTDSAPGLAGAHPGTVKRADVVEVKAANEGAACKVARAKVWGYGTAGGISARFIRWADA